MPWVTRSRSAEQSKAFASTRGKQYDVDKGDKLQTIISERVGVTDDGENIAECWEAAPSHGRC
jgi:hypothetical protein